MDILDNARNARKYTLGMTYDDYAAQRLVQDAVERCLGRISEAAIKLDTFGPEIVPTQDWTRIRGIGNLLRHEYDRLDGSRLWRIVDTGLEPLIADIEAAMRAHGVPEE